MSVSTLRRGMIALARRGGRPRRPGDRTGRGRSTGPRWRPTPTNVDPHRPPRPSRPPAARSPPPTLTVARSGVTGFGGGTIYYPTSTAEGTFGAIAIVPGFTNVQSAVAWLGPRIASQGFVVIIIDTNSTLRPARLARHPAARGAGLPDRDQHGEEPDRRHPARRHGLLDGRRRRRWRPPAPAPSLKASVPLAPYHGTKSWTTRPHADPDRRRRERHHRAAVLARVAVLHQHPEHRWTRRTCC